METIESGIESINSNKQMGHYGVVGRQNANTLYKRYVSWMKENRLGVIPMKFKDWAEWAKHKGIIKNFNAEGDKNDNVLSTEKIEKDTSGITYEINRTGKIVGWTIIGITAIALTIYLIRTSIPKPQALVA